MKKFLFAFLLLIQALNLAAQSRAEKAIDLYPDGVPNSKTAPATYQEKHAKGDWITMVTKPQITPYLPEEGKANGAAVLVFPGGAYAGLANDHEGAQVAQKFAETGVTAFLVKYRLPSDEIMADKRIGPLQDAQRALQFVRQNAAKYHIDPNKVGIIGFSAGGHLVTTTATHFNKAFIANPDQVNLRPDFLIAIYPVVSLGEYRHAGSRDNLLGKNPAQEQIDYFSNEKQVTKDTPPTFLVHAQDDDVVPVQNSLLFYDALLKNGVKAEMHIYQAGGHGFGLHNAKEPEDWFEDLKAWMKLNGWVK
ncbi:alpha/beta hydrolase [Mucilaginibacter sp. RS28]|uniref:Alpha/beta hydrolase n=1 Tax=Mucilaginibacter straminoryzae TaxID=2932774 RepID=A0A9X1X1F5_9SPHI|nr:alpha/beta hydrolase [Mucilaginibacter straminoryzae]MCJ8209303.1 alpha/beta hydrolase [Mucilaginibacter straminoryzae]